MWLGVAMKRTILAALLCLLIVESAVPQKEGSEKRTWTKVQYLGGALGVRREAVTWKNVLLVSSEVIQLSSKDKVLFEIDPKRVTALAYERQKLFTRSEIAGGAAGGVTQSVSTAAATGTAVAPAVGAAVVVPFIVVMMNSAEHYIAIEYTLPDGRASGVLLRADKSNFKDIVRALRSVTGITEAPPPLTDSKDQKTQEK